MDDFEFDDEEIDMLVKQMKGMPLKYKQDVLLAAQKLLRKETEISLEVLGKCRQELNYAAARDQEESRAYENDYADSSPESSPKHRSNSDANDTVSQTGNAFQARAQQNKLSYARPISARPTTASSGKVKTLRMNDKASIDREKIEVSERPSTKGDDSRLANLKQPENPDELNEQKSAILKNMSKQDTKLENERERQRSALRQRMLEQKEKKQEQQAGRAFEMLDNAKVGEQSHMQNKEKQEQEIRNRIESLKKQREVEVTDVGDDAVVVDVPVVVDGQEKKRKKKTRETRVEMAENPEAPPESEEQQGEKRKKKKKKAKAVEASEPEAEDHQPAEEKPRKKKKNRTATSDSTVVEIDTNESTF